MDGRQTKNRLGSRRGPCPGGSALHPEAELQRHPWKQGEGLVSTHFSGVHSNSWQLWSIADRLTPLDFAFMLAGLTFRGRSIVEQSSLTTCTSKKHRHTHLICPTCSSTKYIEQKQSNVQWNTRYEQHQNREQITLGFICIGDDQANKQAVYRMRQPFVAGIGIPCKRQTLAMTAGVGHSQYSPMTIQSKFKVGTPENFQANRAGYR